MNCGPCCSPIWRRPAGSIPSGKCLIRMSAGQASLAAVCFSPWAMRKIHGRHDELSFVRRYWLGLNHAADAGRARRAGPPEGHQKEESCEAPPRPVRNCPTSGRRSSR
ncbi:hypothetical protein BCEP4_1620008 [Burkholderia cepacia]|nr:hypothetical protein BCEP4_1620008 [Burkholderia cepacia]